VDDTTKVRRWVGGPDSAGEAAQEFVKVLVRQPWWWGLVALVEVGCALLLGLSFDDQFGPLERALWGAVYALVPTLCVVVFVLTLGYFVNRRRFRERIREGVVLEASLGERSLTLRSPWAEHALSFDGLSKVLRSGDWIFLKQRGVPIWAVWPAELFPPEDLARLRRGIAGQQR
jgi:hypothetical protein